MVKATKLQEIYRRHLNRRNTDCEKSISVADGDAYLNEAMDVIFENLALKFELNDLMTNHLRQLKITEHKVVPESFNENISKAKLPDDFYKLNRIYAKACNKDCNKERVIKLHVTQTSDLTNSLSDPYWKPSFEWERGLVNHTGNDLFIYHNCEFDPKEVYFDYLRKPKHIQTPSLTRNGSYIKSDGSIADSDIDFEIDSTYLYNKICRLAAINTLLDFGDQQDYSAELNNLMVLEKVFLN